MKNYDCKTEFSNSNILEAEEKYIRKKSEKDKEITVKLFRNSGLAEVKVFKTFHKGVKISHDMQKYEK